jgi:hypothetical protein
MWFVVIALASIVTSLVLGRLLAKASTEQTFNPHPVRGPSVGRNVEADRLAIAQNAARQRSAGPAVHLN